MARTYQIPGAAYIDELRRKLTSLELEFSGGEQADPMRISALLTTIETNRAMLEGAITDELSYRDRPAVDVSEL